MEGGSAALKLEEGGFQVVDVDFTRAITRRGDGAGLSIFRDGRAPKRGGQHGDRGLDSRGGGR